jgi:hypothetical protein
MQELEPLHGFLETGFIPFTLAGCIWRLGLILGGWLLVHGSKELLLSGLN